MNTNEHIQLVANMSEGEVEDVRAAVDLALSMATKGKDLPLGMEIAICEFVRTNHYRALPKERTYGEVARAYLEYLMSKSDERRAHPQPA